MNSRLKLTGLSAAILLSGCASQTPLSRTVVTNPPAHPLNELRSIAVEARDELRLLAKIVDAKNAPSLTAEQHAQKEFQATHVPKGFERIAKFSYTGPATKAANALAQVAGYQFKTLGAPLPNEPWVTVHVDNLPLNEALKEVGLQTGSAIRLEVQEASRLMVLVYKR
jgi:hypothetical protein